MNTWNNLADQSAIDNTVAALKSNGIEAVVVENKLEAQGKIEEIVEDGSEVMVMSSETLNNAGITELIEKSGKYVSVKQKLNNMNRETQGREMQMMGAVPQIALGSVHAVTEEGQLVIASNTGSQLGAYAYGSEKVVWVVGTQKIVKNLDEAMKRIYEYVLPLESERVKKAYGMERSNVSKLLIINKEVKPGRAVVVLVKESLGF
jgi:L-lactate utilization protein LutB